MGIRRYFPILEWLPHYRLSDLRSDSLAGLTVAVMLIPQGMAYGLLAGLPPIYGLYASIVPLLLYAFFGTSRQLSVGPVALVSLLVLTGVGQFAEPGTGRFVSLAITTALVAGIIQVGLGLFRLGFLINFLAHPVISGFTSAAAVIIGASQLKNLLGIDIPRSNLLHEVVYHTAQNIENTDLTTLALGLGGIAVMAVLRRINKALPGALIAVILGVAVVYFGNLQERGIAIVGDVPSGLPAFQLPELNGERLTQLFPLALTICFISFIESLAIAKTIEAQHKSYRVIPNQELLALGITKIGGAFFQSYPTTGSFTRSAINNDAGARTGISSIISAALIALILLFFTPYFFYLPKAVLASVILMAVVGLVDVEEAKSLWSNDRRDFLTLVVTFIATLTLGIQNGVFFGILLSLALVIYTNSRPHYAVLGRLPNSNTFRSIERFREARREEGVLILRFDAMLYFGNADFFRETVENLIEQQDDAVQLLILDCSSIHDIDSTGVHALEEVMQYLQTRGIRFYLAGVIGPVRDRLYRYGLMEKIGLQNQFLKISDALQYYRTTEEETITEGWTYRALQTNLKEKGREEGEISKE